MVAASPLPDLIGKPESLAAALRQGIQAAQEIEEAPATMVARTGEPIRRATSKLGLNIQDPTFAEALNTKEGRMAGSRFAQMINAGPFGYGSPDDTSSSGGTA